MVLVSERKTMKLHELELVIRRCPVCLKDTEQDSFYVQNPDFSVEAMTPTTPQFKVEVIPKEEHAMNWYIVAKCRECGYLYKVTGIPQYKLKELKQPKVIDVELALFCCDICYNDEAKYENADIFIRLSEGKNAYLCERHAAEAEKERARDGSYSSLLRKFNVWRINDAMPKAVQLADRRVVALVGDRGYMEQILKELASGEAELQDLVDALKGRGSIHKTPKLIELQVRSLQALGLVMERHTGSVFRKRYVSLTYIGEQVADKIGQ